MVVALLGILNRVRPICRSIWIPARAARPHDRGCRPGCLIRTPNAPSDCRPVSQELLLDTADTMPNLPAPRTATRPTPHARARCGRTTPPMSSTRPDRPEAKGCRCTRMPVCTAPPRPRLRASASRPIAASQFASVSFDVSMWEFFGLLSGAALVLPSARLLLERDYLSNLASKHDITHATLPPAALAPLAPNGLASVGTLIVTGEASSGDIVRTWSPGRQLFNAYGPTETTVCSTMRGPTRRRRRAADRPADLEHARLRAGRCAAAGSGGRGG